MGMGQSLLLPYLGDNHPLASINQLFHGHQIYHVPVEMIVGPFFMGPRITSLRFASNRCHQRVPARNQGNPKAKRWVALEWPGRCHRDEVVVTLLLHWRYIWSCWPRVLFGQMTWVVNQFNRWTRSHWPFIDVSLNLIGLSYGHHWTTCQNVFSWFCW